MMKRVECISCASDFDLFSCIGNRLDDEEGCIISTGYYADTPELERIIKYVI